MVIKSLLLALALTTTAQAEPRAWLELPNRAGGKIYLVGSPCKPNTANSTGKVAWAVEAAGTTYTGCWWVWNAQVTIAWETGDNLSYPLTDFDYIQQVRR